MVVVKVTLHPQGLHPLEAIKAWQLREEGEKWDDIRSQLTNLQGNTPSHGAVFAAVRRVRKMGKDQLLPTSNYKNCGRKKLLNRTQERAIVKFVRQWRSKRFCTCRYIMQELALPVDRRTVGNVLNRAGYYWRPVPKATSLSPSDLTKRRQFWADFGGKKEAWWEAHFNLCLDGVTLTTAPKPLNARQKHMAQRITHMWMKKGENHDNEVHTHNRYGVQLGTKVPLWGGFTGGGEFSLRLWTARAKMTKTEWIQKMPRLKKAIDKHDEPRGTIKAKVWHDNEKFLLAPAAYRKHGMQMVNFPTNSGDLNPIETVWARLRLDLAKLEQKDFAKKPRVFLSVAQFKVRATTLLASYAKELPGQKYSFLQKLVRGMPKRLIKMKKNQFGRCGK